MVSNITSNMRNEVKSVLSLLSADGSVSLLTDELSGWELDQPYVQGQFSASAGVVAFTQGNATTPTELAVVIVLAK